MLVGGDPDGLLRGWPSEQRLMCEEYVLGSSQWERVRVRT